MSLASVETRDVVSPDPCGFTVGAAEGFAPAARFIASFKCLGYFVINVKGDQGSELWGFDIQLRVYRSTSCHYPDIPPIPICIPLRVSDQPVPSSTASLR